jgi:DNA-binding NarL/FixJ family response regulator
MARRFNAVRIAPCEARAADVLCSLLASGKASRTKDVAREMRVSEDAVKHYLMDVMRKTLFFNRVEFVMAWKCPIFRLGLQANGMIR